MLSRITFAHEDSEILMPFSASEYLREHPIRQISTGYHATAAEQIMRRSRRSSGGIKSAGLNENERESGSENDISKVEPAAVGRNSRVSRILSVTTEHFGAMEVKADQSWRFWQLYVQACR